MFKDSWSRYPEFVCVCVRVTLEAAQSIQPLAHGSTLIRTKPSTKLGSFSWNTTTTVISYIIFIIIIIKTENQRPSCPSCLLLTASLVRTYAPAPTPIPITLFMLMMSHRYTLGYAVCLKITHHALDWTEDGRLTEAGSWQMAASQPAHPCWDTGTYTHSHVYITSEDITPTWGRSNSHLTHRCVSDSVSVSDSLRLCRTELLRDGEPRGEACKEDSTATDFYK